MVKSDNRPKTSSVKNDSPIRARPYQIEGLIRYRYWLPKRTEVRDDHVLAFLHQGVGLGWRIRWNVPPHLGLANLPTYDADGKVSMKPEPQLRISSRDVAPFVERYGVLRGKVSVQEMRKESAELKAAGIFDDNWNFDDDAWSRYYNTPKGRTRDEQSPTLIYREDVSDFAAAQTVLRQAWLGEDDAIAAIGGQLIGEGFSIDPFHPEGLTLNALNLWGFICFLFMYDYRAGKVGVCANPECLVPYYLKRRRNQKFCESGPCTVYAQRQYALRWWNNEGKARRAKRLNMQRRSQK